MTQPAKPHTITTHWQPIDELEPTTDTAPDWPTARSQALKLTTLAGTIAVVIRDPDGELIANWDAYSNLWREPRPRPTINPTTVDRARILAADYRANPTPARAHNAAQVLWDVLGTLDAVVARTSRIAALATQLDMPPKICPGFPIAEPHFARLACFLPEGHPGEHDNQPLAAGGIVDTTTTASIGENS